MLSDVAGVDFGEGLLVLTLRLAVLGVERIGVCVFGCFSGVCGVLEWSV